LQPGLIVGSGDHRRRLLASGKAKAWLSTKRNGRIPEIRTGGTSGNEG
jgi:hypothetical protein